MISPLENNNMVVRAQDFSAIRQNELNHSQTTHVVIQDQIDREESQQVHSVRKKDDSDKADTHHDAKEEGKNKYYSSERKKRDKDKLDEGVVVPKSSGGFNVTV